MYMGNNSLSVAPSGELQYLQRPANLPSTGMGFLDDVELVILAGEVKNGMQSIQRIDRNVSLYGPLITISIAAIGIGLMVTGYRNRRR